MSTARRIGLFGGSFDPPHLAHLALARAARDQLALDEVRWLPAGQPWQKAGRPVTPAAHRAAMVAAMIDGEPRFVQDDRELRRSGPTYTLDTVDELAAECPGAELFLIIGQDQYGRLHTWHRAADLVRKVTLAVASRAGEAPRPPADAAVAAARCVAIDMPPMSLSATDVRSQRAHARDVTLLVGAAVAGYIGRHALYQERDES